ncbi:MAG: hypothetical protein FWE32_06790 [Oscillospiraceae bacterium]|nr:hypothetical protein [Oscillospiraceae bacterium]
MKNMGIVRGSKEVAHTPFEVCVDTVFLRFNPTLIPPTEGGDDDMAGMGEQWAYHEIQYSLREWLQILTESVIDTASFALNDGLVKDLEALPVEIESDGGIFAEMTYIGLAEQKPFTFTTKFTQRRST